MRSSIQMPSHTQHASDVSAAARAGFGGPLGGRPEQSAASPTWWVLSPGPSACVRLGASRIFPVSRATSPSGVWHRRRPVFPFCSPLGRFADARQTPRRCLRHAGAPNFALQRPHPTANARVGRLCVFIEGQSHRGGFNCSACASRACELVRSPPHARAHMHDLSGDTSPSKRWLVFVLCGRPEVVASSSRMPPGSVRVVVAFTSSADQVVQARVDCPSHGIQQVHAGAEQCKRRRPCSSTTCVTCIHYFMVVCCSSGPGARRASAQDTIPVVQGKARRSAH